MHKTVNLLRHTLKADVSRFLTPVLLSAFHHHHPPILDTPYNHVHYSPRSFDGKHHV
ncbi:hypothetical protein B0H17DRAFT_1123472 [Mycena rosella]|uniref:Uncharacterized protein n=1 Tax=Mycena rosella TaxID=1033263 RepID=A0AAD7AWB1_MYCRO|nr:hypothetical protein B0H17DRAFT_1123472 [Mycena rosella]